MNLQLKKTVAEIKNISSKYDEEYHLFHAVVEFQGKEYGLVYESMNDQVEMAYTGESTFDADKLVAKLEKQLAEHGVTEVMIFDAIDALYKEDAKKAFLIEKQTVRGTLPITISY